MKVYIRDIINVWLIFLYVRIDVICVENCLIIDIKREEILERDLRGWFYLILLKYWLVKYIYII